MPKPTENQRIGTLGEDIAVRFIQNKGFTVITRNYRKKCGEIDIIAQKSKILHFVEVKSVSRENITNFADNVSRETDEHRPEDNIHPAKLKRLSRAIQIYLLEKHPKDEPIWQFDAITVKIDLRTKQARAKLLENIIL